MPHAQICVRYVVDLVTDGKQVGIKSRVHPVFAFFIWVGALLPCAPTGLTLQNWDAPQVKVIDYDLEVSKYQVSNFV